MARIQNAVPMAISTISMVTYVVVVVFLSSLVQTNTALALMSSPSTVVLRSTMHMTSENPFATEQTSAAVLTDSNGVVFQVGDVVRVARENLKAYQVPSKGQGTFDEKKQFVPAPKNAPRGTKNLLMPIGIRGTITKIYDTEDISANHPIQVKFTPGQYVDEGYDPPVHFMMHFSPLEINCV